MPQVFRLASEYFWALALVFATFNYWQADRASAASLSGEARESARIYLRIFAAGAAAPWLMMGLGHLSGATPTIWNYFRPQDGNAFVVAWMATNFILLCCFAWWVWFAGGARKVSELNLMSVISQRGANDVTEAGIKRFAVAAVVVFPAWLVLVASMNAPVPRF